MLFALHGALCLAWTCKLHVEVQCSSPSPTASSRIIPVLQVPCGHRALCIGCAESARRSRHCPICRTQILSCVRVFDA